MSARVYHVCESCGLTLTRDRIEAPMSAVCPGCKRPLAPRRPGVDLGSLVDALRWLRGRIRRALRG